MRDSDDHIVVGVHIFGVELGRHLDDLGLTLVAVLLFDLQELGVNHVVTHLLAGEQFVEVRDQFLDLLVLVLQLVNTQPREGTQTHIYDRLRLQVVEVETCLEVRLCIGRRTAGTDDTNHLVNIIYGDD